MPRYFFNISDQPDVLDIDGVELPDMSSVRSEAVRACGEILRDHGYRDRLEMVVLNQTGETVLTLSFRSDEAEIGGVSTRSAVHKVAS